MRCGAESESLPLRVLVTAAVATRGGARAGELPVLPDRTYDDRSGTVCTHVNTRVLTD